jgi:uncharacterized protein YajQ (UPF0234 family)
LIKNEKTMPSLDIASKVDPQVVENAINVAKKEIQNRYDFSGSNTDIDFNKKELRGQAGPRSAQL